MARHEVDVIRSGEGVIGRCSCRVKQMQPVMTRQEAEDWTLHHLEQVARAQADPGKQLTGAKYLAYLREQSTSRDQSASNRALFKQLADEYEKRSREPAPTGGLPKSPNASFNTGVETEPLF